MRKFTFFIFFVSIYFSCKKDCNDLGITDFEFVTITELPSELKEASGLETVGNSFFSFNDNSGEKAIFEFNQNGDLVRTIKISNERKDWEDLTQDEEGNFYIGDFGNNQNERTDLKIYKISDDALTSGNSVEPEIIRFSLDDQSEFPPKKDAQHFDIEGFFYSENEFFLFSKDRSEPFVGKTKLYRLSAEIGTHEAVLINEFSTDNCGSEKGAITGVDISPDGQKVVIASNEAVWIFTDFSQNDFFTGKAERYDLPIDRQMEGIVFEDDCTLFLVNEKGDKPAELFRMNICE